MVILKEQLLNIGCEDTVCLYEFAIDSAAELDGLLTDLDRTASAGSLAWDIGTGSIYALDSQGQWQLQNDN